MKLVENKNFNAKILLFGEYSIILGGQALTLPLRRFAGTLELPGDNTDRTLPMLGSNKALRDFADFLKKSEVHNAFFYELDLILLEQDVSAGLFFNSTIPSGYGAGSSGALVASIFYRYTKAFPITGEEETDPEILAKVRKQLSLMESYFHGSSSGLDPLSSLLGKILKAHGKHEISFPAAPLFPDDSKTVVFLVDTGKPGNTKPLVDWFKQQLADDRLDSELLIALNNQAIHTLLTKNMYLFDHFLSQLSMFQLENMKPMVPDNIRPLWEKGLENGEWTLKLCGSGGGGFVLGFADNYAQVEKIFKKEGFITQPLTDL